MGKDLAANMYVSGFESLLKPADLGWRGAFQGVRENSSFIAITLAS
jgi:hypothetical protein